MSSTTIAGRLQIKKDTQVVSDKFQKREFVIETEGTYPQFIAIELHKDNVGLIDNISIGTYVTCHININGRKWTSPSGEDKYFNTLVCWKIEAQQNGAQPQQQAAGSITQAGTTATPPDDLPF